MTILFMGSSMSDFDYAPNCVARTTSTYIDTTKVPEGVGLGGIGGAFARKTFTAAAEGWIGWRMAIDGDSPSSVASIPFYLLSGASALGLFRLVHDTGGSGFWNGNYGDLQYWNGSAWTNYAFNFWGLPAGVHKFDLNVKMHASAGFVKFYIDGVLVHDTGLINTTLSGQTTFNAIQFSHSGGSTQRNVAVSEFFVSTTDDSRDVRVADLALSSNGVNTGWTNDIAAIDEVAYDDADFISAASSGLKESFVVGNIPGSLAAYDVIGVAVSARARIGSSGPQNIKGLVRTGGTDFSSANIGGLEMAFRGGIQAIWETNPDTAATWTQAEVNGAEIGVESAA